MMPIFADHVPSRCDICQGSGVDLDLAIDVQRANCQMGQWWGGIGSAGGDMHMTKVEPSVEFGQVATYASDLALSNPSAILAARLAVDRLRVHSQLHRHRACAPVRYAYDQG